MSKRTHFISNLCILLVLVGISTALVIVDLSGVFLTVSAPVTGGTTGRGEVSLMITANTGAQQSRHMIDKLERLGTPSTWFVSGAWVATNMTLARRISANAGLFEAGNYGWNCNDMRGTRENDMKRDIRKTHNLLYTLSGERNVQPTLFSPPGGLFNRNVLRVAESFGYTTVLWSRTTAALEKSEYIVHAATQNVMDGDIIHLTPSAQSLAALPKIIEFLRTQGFNIVTVSDNLM